MHKRLSIRLVNELAASLDVIARKRGLSVNSLISEMAWDFVDSWNLSWENKKAQLQAADADNTERVAQAGAQGRRTLRKLVEAERR